MKKQEFILTKQTWHEATDNLDVQPIADALNSNIKLSDYGTGIKAVYFTFIVVKPDNPLHENDVRFDKKKKQLEVSLNLSYPHVLSADPSAVLKMMAMLFFVSIDLWEGIEIGGFDLSKFKDDVERLFDVKGWLVKENI